MAAWRVTQSNVLVNRLPGPNQRGGFQSVSAAEPGGLRLCDHAQSIRGINSELDGQLDQFVGILPPVIGVVVDGRNNNLATTKADGVDYTAAYQWSTANAGSFEARLAGTQYLRFDQGITPTAPLVAQLNNINFPVKTRLRGGLSWNLNGWSASSFVNYTGTYVNNLVTPYQEVASYATFDVRAGYTLGNGVPHWIQGTTVSLSAMNLFDKDPPFVALAPLAFGGGGGFDPQLANPIGRLVGITIDKRW